MIPQKELKDTSVPTNLRKSNNKSNNTGTQIIEFPKERWKSSLQAWEMVYILNPFAIYYYNLLKVPEYVFVIESPQKYHIDENNIEQLIAKLSTPNLRSKMEYALHYAFNSIIDQFSDLVTEVYAPEDFSNGEIVGQYQLVIVIKQEEYSVIEVLMKLADAIFGPLFLETGFLFGLTVLSEQEWDNLRKSEDGFNNPLTPFGKGDVNHEEIDLTDILGKMVCLLFGR